MEYISLMIKNVIFFMLLSNIMLNLVNGNEYRKYIKVFCGFLLIVLLINPLFDLIDLVGGIGNKDTSDYLGDISSDINIEEIENIGIENVKHQYIVEIKNKVDVLLQNEKIKFKESNVYEEEGEYFVSIELVDNNIELEEKVIELINGNLYIPKTNIFII